MQSDVGTLMVAGSFALALLVFGIAAARRFARGRAGGVEAPGSPPPLPAAAWVGGNLSPVSPYEPAQAPPPLPAAGCGWRVPSRIYNWYDLPMMALLVLLYAAAPVVMLVLDRVPDEGVDLATIVGTILMQFFLTALVVGFVAWRVRPVEWLGLCWPKWRWALLIAPAAVGATWIVLIVLQLTGYNDWLQGHIGDDGRQDVVKAFGEADDPLLLALLCFTAVVVAPVTEEILFRGYLYPASKRFIGRWGAVVFSSLVFAVAHANALALLPLLLLAVLLTLAYEMTGSLWAPIGIHLLFNGLTVSFQLLAKWGIIELPAT